MCLSLFNTILHLKQRKSYFIFTQKSSSLHFPTSKICDICSKTLKTPISSLQNPVYPAQNPQNTNLNQIYHYPIPL